MAPRLNPGLDKALDGSELLLRDQEVHQPLGDQAQRRAGTGPTESVFFCFFLREGTGLKEWDESLLALGITVHGSTDAARVRSALSQACAAGASLRVLGTLLDILRFIPCKPGKVSFAGDTKAVSVKELVSRPCAWDGDHVDWCPGGFSGSNTHGHFQNADWC